MRLAQKYKPKNLSEVFGQSHAVNFLKGVVSNPDIAPRNYALLGSYGLGKSAICEAFHGSFVEKFPGTEFLSIDSGDSFVQNSFDRVQSLIFSESRYGKVVIIDECHILQSVVIQKFLKVLESSSNPKLFLFFATTEEQLLPAPLLDRLIVFHLNLFSHAQSVQYLERIVAREGVSLPASTLDTIALNAQGHIRTLLKHLEALMFQGEEAYLLEYNALWSSIERFFTDFSIPDKEFLTSLSGYHPIQLRPYFDWWWRNRVIDSSAPDYGKVFPPALHPKMFQFYLKNISIATDNDSFFTVLLMLRQQLRQVVSQSKS